ncbi:hypothetical protein GCM10007857_71100 [Bradyrhizobium iriomotense]|uniref:Uncharacterized protein n=1 Tax=Bradyrhizobium iriomotense TaxID=441950 RepID=A0ABQ6B7N3_9BRAD|nr:hypothetical protein GCM10007857_71100 [Bradyrhizobium iriomotense]
MISLSYVKFRIWQYSHRDPIASYGICYHPRSSGMGHYIFVWVVTLLIVTEAHWES